jgi:riboflavin kinase/FMN adenylyltransferase
VSLGINYTVGGTDLRVESHLLDIEDLNLYGAIVALDFVDRRRDMLDFGSVEALVVALAEDVVWCREVLELG